MPDPELNRDETISNFLSSGEAFQAEINGLAEPALDYSLAPGEWSIRQIIHHVSDDGDVWSFITKRAAVIPGSPVQFGHFPGNEAWACGLAFERRPAASSLELIGAHRRYMAAMASELPDAWGYQVSLAGEDGKVMATMSFGQIFQMLTEHIQEHTATVRAIKARHGLA